MPPHHRIPLGGPPRRWLAAGPVEPLAQRADQHPVEQPVEHHLLAGDVERHFGGEMVQHRVAGASGLDPQHHGQGVQQATADLTAHRIGADDQGGRARAGRGAVVPAEPVSGTALVGGGAEFAAGQRFRRRIEFVDEHERSGTAHDDCLVRAEPLRRAVVRDDPAGAVEHCGQGQWRAVDEVQCPRRGQRRTAEERPVGANAAEQITEDVHLREGRRSDRNSGALPMEPSAATRLTVVMSTEADALTAEDLEFLRRPLHGYLTTAAGPLPPEPRPVWFEATEDGAVQLFTPPQSAKIRRLRRDPRASSSSRPRWASGNAGCRSPVPSPWKPTAPTTWPGASPRGTGTSTTRSARTTSPASWARSRFASSSTRSA